MAAPVDAARTGTNVTTAATSHSINVGSPAAGVCLVVFIRFAGDPGTVTFTGYSQLVTDNSDASDDVTRVYTRQADGAEGSTDALSTTNSIKLAAICWQITGAADPSVTAPNFSTAAIGTTANANSTIVFVGGGPKDVLAMALLGMDSETGTATVPSGYGNQTSANSGTGGAVATNCIIWGGTLGITNCTSEDPAAWTSSAPANGWTAWTIVVPAATVAPSALVLEQGYVDHANPGVL